MATVAPWQAADYFISEYGRVPTAAEITATQATMQQVSQAYEQNLGRAPDPGGLAYYTTEILSGKADVGRVADILADSSEARANAATTTTNTAAAAKPVVSAPITNTNTSGAAKTVLATPITNTNTSGATSGIASIPITLPTRTDSNTSLAGQIIGPVNPATGPTYYPSDLSILVDPAAVAAAKAEADRLAAKAKADAAAARAAAEAAVKSAFKAVLGRDPDANSLKFFADEIEAGRMPQASIATNIAYGAQGDDRIAANRWAQANLGQVLFPGLDSATTEDAGVAARRTEITNLYKSVFGRDPDPGGLDFYLTGGGKDLDLTKIGDIFRDSPEFKVKNPAKDDKGNIIAPELRDQIVNLYQRNLGRTPSDSEIEGWISTFQKGTTKPGTTDPIAYISDGLITSAGREAFMIGANQELARRSREAFIGKIPKFDVAKAGLFPTQFTFPTEQRPQEILGITGRPTTPGGIANLYQRFLGRAPDPEGLQLHTQKFGPTMTPQGVSDFISDIYGPGGELARREGVLPELAYRGLAAPPQAPTLSYGSQQVSPFGFIPPTEEASGTSFARPIGVPIGTPATPSGKAGGLVAYKEGGMPKLSAKEAGSQFDVSQYIDPETGRFYINEFQRDVVFNPELREAERIERERMSRMAKGGLASIAENLAEKGRGGDSMLVHMAPEEVAGLRGLAMQMGGDLSINPQTGLPEAKWLKKLLPLLPFIPGIGQILGPIAASMGSIGTTLSNFAATYPLLAKSAAAATIAGFTAPGKGFNFKEGLKTGITAFAGGKLFEALGSLEQLGKSGVGASTPQVDPFSYGSPEMYSSAMPAEAASQLMPPSTVPPTTAAAAAPTSVPGQNTFSFNPASGEMIPTDFAQQQAAMPTSMEYVPTPDYISKAQGRVDAVLSGKDLTPPPAAGGERTILGMTPGEISLGVTGVGALSAANESRKASALAAAQAREEEDERRRYQSLFAQTLGRIPMGAGGGLVAMAQGGMPTFEYGGTTAPTGEPRMVKGAGDGMSDNVPANIEGVQEARLANDEFVVPADVVADIGNGSSSAGAKKLYAMMDRIRKARHGTTEQPPEIEAERLMPA